MLDKPIPSNTSKSKAKTTDDPKNADTTGKKQTTAYTRPTLGKCFRCGQVGHLFNECPQRKTLNFVEDLDTSCIQESDEEQGFKKCAWACA